MSLVTNNVSLWYGIAPRALVSLPRSIDIARYYNIIDPYRLRFTTIDYNIDVYCLQPRYRWTSWFNRIERLAARLLPKRSKIENMLPSFCEILIQTADIYSILFQLFAVTSFRCLLQIILKKYEKSTSLIIPHWLSFTTNLMVRIRSRLTGVVTPRWKNSWIEARWPPRITSALYPEG